MSDVAVEPVASGALLAAGAAPSQASTFPAPRVTPDGFPSMLVALIYLFIMVTFVLATLRSRRAS